MTDHPCDCLRHRGGGLISGIQKHYLDTNVKPRFDPVLDVRSWDTHFDLTGDGEAKPRPATWQEQIACLLAEDVWANEVTFD